MVENFLPLEFDADINAKGLSIETPLQLADEKCDVIKKSINY